MAASLASLRIAWDNKASYRLAKSLLLLGAPGCTLDILDLFHQDYKSQQTEQLGEVALIFKEREAFCNPDLVLDEIPPELAPNWYSPNIETYSAGTKGRGVRATISLQAGQCILVERPIATCETKKEGMVLTVTADSLVDDASQSAIKSAIILRSQRDAILTRVVSNLSDGKQKMAVVPFSDLLLHLDMFDPSLPFLPGHFDYYDESPELEGPLPLVSDKVGRIVKVNAHGFNRDGTPEGSLKPGKTTELFPALSMFNHAKNPNCRWTGSNDRCTVLLLDDVQEGEELTVSYHPDDDKARAAWGF